jgi:hypothetical protein
MSYSREEVLALLTQVIVDAVYCSEEKRKVFCRRVAGDFLDAYDKRRERGGE